MTSHTFICEAYDKIINLFRVCECNGLAVRSGDDRFRIIPVGPNINCHFISAYNHVPDFIDIYKLKFPTFTSFRFEVRFKLPKFRHKIRMFHVSYSCCNIDNEISEFLYTDHMFNGPERFGMWNFPAEYCELCISPDCNRYLFMKKIFLLQRKLGSKDDVLSFFDELLLRIV